MTPTQSTAEQLEVTQADREAAASTQDHFPLTAKVIRAGKHDHTQLVQAFARHRQATEAHIAALEEALRERMERLPPEFETAIYSDLEGLYEESAPPKASAEQEPGAG